MLDASRRRDRVEHRAHDPGVDLYVLLLSGAPRPGRHIHMRRTNGQRFGGRAFEKIDGDVLHAGDEILHVHHGYAVNDGAVVQKNFRYPAANDPRRSDNKRFNLHDFLLFAP